MLFEPYPYQVGILTDHSPRRIVLKARQTGISNTFAIEALHKAITRPMSTELFVSKNQAAAQELVLYCQRTLTGLRNPPKLLSESKSELGLPNGSRIVSLPASPGTGRSFAATDVYLDEFAHAEYAELIYESIVPTVSTGGRLTVASTPNGRNNLFFRLWQGPDFGEWSRHRIHWSDCPRYDDEWAQKMRSSMSRQSWAQEYDLDFISSGDAVFSPEDLERAQQGWNPDPEGCTRFIHAWDIGRRHDPTVGLTIGLRGDIWNLINLHRFYAPYPVIQQRIEQRHAWLRGETWVESNGVGDPVVENLSIQVNRFVTTAKTKLQAIQSAQLLFEQSRFKHDHPVLHQELSLYEWDDKDLVQDCVMALAIAAHAAEPDPRAAWAEAIGKSAAINYGSPSEPHWAGPIGEEMERLDRRERQMGRRRR